MEDFKSQVSEIGRAVRNLSEQLLNQQSRDVSSRTFLFTDRERTPLRPLPVKQHSLTLLVCDQNFHGGQGWWMGRGAANVRVENVDNTGRPKGAEKTRMTETVSKALISTRLQAQQCSASSTMPSSEDYYGTIQYFEEWSSLKHRTVHVSQR